MNVAGVIAILDACKGSFDVGGEAAPGCEAVDVWRLLSLRTDRVWESAAEMYDFLVEWPAEMYGKAIPALGETITIEDAVLALGGVATTRAFQLFAFGKLLGWWRVEHAVDPADETRSGKRIVQMSGYEYAFAL